MQESSGNPRARRYEPHHDVAGRGDAATDGDLADKDNGDMEDDASYGLMQILGQNVRVLCGVPPGVPMDFSMTYEPLFGLAFGLKMLTIELAATGGNVDRALARYNGGPSGERLVPGPNGMVLRRQEYVDGVARWIERVHKDRGGML